MFRNILSNALKFTPAGGTVAVRIMVSENRMLVEVQDSGVGISDENQKRLFNEVVQFHAKAHQGGGGSGLGLWISTKIVDMHGGSIGVRSEGEGRGSTFYFSLPVTTIVHEQTDVHPAATPRFDVSLGTDFFDIDRDPPQFQARAYHPPPPATAGIKVEEMTNGAPPLSIADREISNNDLVNMRVLVVDDSALNRKMMVNRLAKLGCSVSVADDGDTAVALVQQTIGTEEGYDVITMDNVR